MTHSDTPFIQVNEEQLDSDDVPLDLLAFANQLSLHLNLNVHYIEITLLPELAIQQLNSQYFNVDEATDTITFNLTPNEAITGDIYLCPSIIKKNAEKFSCSYEKEFRIVLIHSFLHLLGHDDQTPDSFEAMKQKQESIYEALLK